VTFWGVGAEEIRRLQVGGVTSAQSERDISLALGAVAQLTRLHEEQIRIEPVSPSRVVLDDVIIAELDIEGFEESPLHGVPKAGDPLPQSLLIDPEPVRESLCFNKAELVARACRCHIIHELDRQLCHELEAGSSDLHTAPEQDLAALLVDSEH
jgi:hypothetical protein